MKSTHIHLGYVSISECQKCYSKFAIKKKITPGKIHPGQFTKNGCYLIRQDKFDGDVISLLLKYAHDEEKYAEIVTALFVQMYIGTSELRKYGVRHNDLHAGNIFYKKVPRKTWKSGKVSVDSEYQFYIADFSRGKVCGREKTMNISQAAFFKRELKQLEKSIRAFHGEIIPPNSLLDSAAKAISQK